MISDVLYEAIREIEEYEEKMPEAYGPMKNRIQEVKDAMRKLQRELDTPPTKGLILVEEVTREVPELKTLPVELKPFTRKRDE